MQVTITVFGPLGTQKKYQHEDTNFKSCVKKVAEDLMSMPNAMTEDRQQEWEKLEVKVERK